MCERAWSDGAVVCAVDFQSKHCGVRSSHTSVFSFSISGCFPTIKCVCTSTVLWKKWKNRELSPARNSHWELCSVDQAQRWWSIRSALQSVRWCNSGTSTTLVHSWAILAYHDGRSKVLGVCTITYLERLSVIFQSRLNNYHLFYITAFKFEMLRELSCVVDGKGVWFFFLPSTIKELQNWNGHKYFTPSFSMTLHTIAIGSICWTHGTARGWHPSPTSSNINFSSARHCGIHFKSSLKDTVASLLSPEMHVTEEQFLTPWRFFHAELNEEHAANAATATRVTTTGGPVELSRAQRQKGNPGFAFGKTANPCPERTTTYASSWHYIIILTSRFSWSINRDFHGLGIRGHLGWVCIHSNSDCKAFA